MDMNWRIHWQARSTRKDKRLVMYLWKSGEAHAGWFQGKVEALYNEELRQHANKKCEDFFRSSEFDKLDLKDIQMTESMPSNFLTGQAGINFGISGNVWTTHMEILGMPGGNISSIPVGKTIRCDF